MNTKRVAKIETLLNQAFSPEYLLVKDQSHFHAGHAGAKDGRGHFEVVIASVTFEGCSMLESHRLIYAALHPLMTTDIHALSIQASAKMRNHSG
jgi:BolA protein